jgi:hypothetical protein
MREDAFRVAGSNRPRRLIVPVAVDLDNVVVVAIAATQRDTDRRLERW